MGAHAGCAPTPHILDQLVQVYAPVTGQSNPLTLIILQFLGKVKVKQDLFMLYQSFEKLILALAVMTLL